MKQMPVHANTSRNQNLSFLFFFSGQAARDPSPAHFSPSAFRAMASSYVPGTPQLQPLAGPPAAQVVAAIPQAPAPPPPAGPPPQAPAPSPPAGLPPAQAQATMQAAEVCTPQRLQEMEEYIMTHHKGPWYNTLNNHASTRPKQYGGPVVPSIRACLSFSWENTAAPDGADMLCILDMPNSFAKSDGRRLQAQGSGNNEKEASENACRQAVAKLLLMEPAEVVLRPVHWKMSPDELLAGLPGADTVHQALPVHVPARTSASGEDAATLSQAEIDDRVAESLRQCLRAHGGSFDPSKISHRKLRLGPEDDRMYSRLNKLLLPTQLRPFVERHPEFSWQEKGPKGMMITWSTSAATSQSAPSTASA